MPPSTSISSRSTSSCAPLQGQALAAFKPTWHARFDDVPEGPLLLVANEFFDALPVRQFEKTARGWTERMVGLDDDGNLRLALAPGVTPFASALPEAAVGAAGRDLRSRAARWPERSASASSATAAGR